MKNCVLFTLMILFTLSLESQEKVAEVTFEKILIDYGIIDHGVDGKRTFNFKNTGTAPLIFNRIYSSCGCTIPKKPEKPILPGESGSIDVEYDTKRTGAFQKAITVNSNAVNSNIILRIKGEILPELELDENGNPIENPKEK
ncbi:MAG: hypothetical protein CMD12_01490 [Flavobacteriales bacterium]|nr:hypothetical protein [Flavobacteriaceae bacterium]MAV80643.1 hypothetical protein [Flavobacteriales bacterium]|tara:strand:+ start:2562 stop:2987 length:426 start_codon:yes stop_codon:yes gene_type:complete